MKNGTALNLDMLDNVSGGALGFNPDENGTYTMICEYSGNVYYGVSLAQVIEIAKFGANIPNTPEGEQQIIAWAHEKKYI